ncbi:ABC transporter permease [Clostridium estertheticum]|uniref:ABC transporter permease n=1 Tax=Clostridium estertheticum TaxID=238834 RepID=UPI001CF40CF3|nr:ABC transporter permease [Clostridium estertheticum]MCB2306739.1 ABC transporter permease [Clostridium estertheticum]MCB2346682.1 ABC transporter permease [Clostridium estertheticum]MCB2350245.1 ABC transporter permease [Clostridium estertheticum]WAG47215.1 ABC transporter permease [Clostridium estertheticum]
MQILKYEMKKIFCKRSAIISLIVLGVYLGSSIFSSVQATWADVADAAGNGISGIKAINLVKNEKMKWNGIVTEKFIGNIIKENHEINSDSKYAGIPKSGTHLSKSDTQLLNMQFYQKQGFMDIQALITDSYCKIHFYDYDIIDSLKVDDASRFYSNRVDYLKKFLASEEANRLTKNEKEYLINSAQTLITPLKYSYADGWMNALEKSATVIFALSFVVCILMAPIFSVEYQTGSDVILLTTEHGKKKGIVYKLFAGLLSTSLVYWITICVVFGFIFMIFGFEGGDSQLQASSYGWKSFYHITNSEALLMVLLLGYVGCLFIGSLTMFLSSKVKTSFATIILIVLIIMVPSTIDQFLIQGSFWDKILNMLPSQMLLGWKLLQTYTLYDFGGKVITPYQLLPVLYGIFASLLLPFAYRAFRKHQIS